MTECGSNDLRYLTLGGMELVIYGCTAISNPCLLAIH